MTRPAVGCISTQAERHAIELYRARVHGFIAALTILIDGAEITPAAPQESAR